MGRHPSRRHVSPGEAPIGRRIRRRRRDLGLTQASLAGPEYTKSFISQLEGGSADPSLDTLRFLSRRLQTSLSALAGDDSDRRLAAVEGLLLWGREAVRARNGPLAHQVLEVAAELAASGGWDLQRAEARLLLAEYDVERGDPAMAAAALAGASGLAAALGPRGLARRDMAAGALALRQRENAAAGSSFRAALASLGKTTRHPDLAIRALLGLAAALGRSGDLTQAGRRLEAAVKLAVRARLPVLHGRALLRLGLLKRQEGAVDEALRLLQEAEAVLDGTDDHESHIEALIYRGRALLDAGDASGALEVARRGASLAATLDDPAAKARASGLAGRALLRHGRVDEALPALTDAVERLQAAGASGDLAEAATDLGQYHRSRGEHNLAEAYLAIAREVARDIQP